MEDSFVTKVQRMREAFERAYGLYLVTYFNGPLSFIAAGHDGEKAVPLTRKHYDFICGYMDA